MALTRSLIGRESSPLSGLGPLFHQIESSDYFLNASRASLGEQHWLLVDRLCNYRALQRAHNLIVT